MILKNPNSIKIDLPKDVEYIISRLCDAGFEAYAVGGCVRDSLMGKVPSDWDITTSAKPDEMMEIFKYNKIIPTGLKHGTITILIGKNSYEITTYRIDGDYFNGRSPESVLFTENLKEDLNRRDFTINAMAYNQTHGLVDCFGGIDDLKNKLIRCVGDADLRFSEDYLRMLRAYRFATTLDFSLEKSLVGSCFKNKNKILDISAERIRAELDKIIISDNFKMIKSFFNVFADVLMPELFELRNIEQNNPYHKYDVYDHTMEVFKNTPNQVDMRLIALFHDMGKKAAKSTDSEGIDHFYGHQKISVEIANEILKRLKYDNKTIDCVLAIVKTHDDRIRPEKKLIRRLINKLGEENALKNLQFQRADVLGQSEFSQNENLPILDECMKLYHEVILSNEACQIKDLAISGEDVKTILNVGQGTVIGETLKFLLDKVIETPSLNERETLINLVKEKLIE